MINDFTLTTYEKLLNTLVRHGYHFQTYADYISKPASKVIVLRHDIDARKRHSLKFARLQHDLGICGTYYFRVIPQSFDPGIIKEISSMGHEIGYHYEDMDFSNGDVDEAYKLARKHLNKLREFVEVKTICMHGSPRSSFDNKEVWRKYDYKKLGIIGEPYFDIDFNKVFYLTDTGRMWDGQKLSLRDTVASTAFELQFHSTFDIINSVKKKNFPHRVMMTFHPQRWTNNPYLWMKELLYQSLKNVVKYGLKKVRN